MVKQSAVRASYNKNQLALTWLFWGGALVTLFFWATFNDPFNAPKSWILVFVGFWLFGWLLFHVKRYFQIDTLRIATIISVTYIVALSISLAVTDNAYIGFFGDYQRRTGYIEYFSLVVFFLAAAYCIRIRQLEKLESISVIVGLILGFYGLAQHFKYDFVHWNNSYNSVISTLGNPDFAGAAMAIFLILNFGVLIQKSKSKMWRLLAGLNIVVLLTVIIFSQVRQALVASVIVLVIIGIIWLYQRNKLLAYLSSASALGTLFFAVLGMLKFGPLSKYFYKVSVTYRGDYWRAGWKMFVHHPFFGVGLDRYGAYFRQYRDATQSLRRGPNLISNAAHNVPLQLAATGGIFVFLAYLILVFFIFWRGISAIRNTQGNQQILAAVIFSAWIVYQAQSLISIDNLAIAVWGYILGGAVVGISLIEITEDFKVRSRFDTQQYFSNLILIIPFVFSILFIKSELEMHSVNLIKPPSNQSDLKAYENFITRPLEFGLKDPYFQFLVAIKKAQAGDPNTAAAMLNKIVADDAKNYDAQLALAQIFEFQESWDKAILVRKRLLILDPFNSQNIFSLGQDYKSKGDVTSAKAVIPLINAFAPNSVEAKQALAILGK
jgi:hypothetical protein